MQNKRGQASIIGIISVFLMIVVFSALAPTIVERISNTSTYLDTESALLLSLVPLMFVIVIILTMFIFATPFRPGG